MRGLLSVSAAAVALLVPAVASADVRGVVELGYESAENDDFDYDFDSLQIGGAIVTDLTPAWTLQVDARSVQQSYDDDDYNQSHAGVHVAYDFGGWQVGGVAGIVGYFGDSTLNFGAETRTAFGPLSLNAAAVFGNGDSDGTDLETESLRGNAAWFFTPNFNVSAGIGNFEADYEGFVYEYDSWNVGAAFQFANNVEIYGNYSETDLSFSFSSSEPTVDAFRVGVRLHFNGGTLQDNTNNGAWYSLQEISDVWSRY